jgi:hypothetical protein
MISFLPFQGLTRSCEQPPDLDCAPTWISISQAISSFWFLERVSRMRPVRHKDIAIQAIALFAQGKLIEIRLRIGLGPEADHARSGEG